MDSRWSLSPQFSGGDGHDGEEETLHFSTASEESSFIPLPRWHIQTILDGGLSG